MSPVHRSNCEEDVDKFLFSLAKERSAAAVTDDAETPTTSRLDSLLTQLPESVRQLLVAANFTVIEMIEGLDQQETNVLVYIAGYILKKLKHSMCNDCCLKLSGSLDASNKNHDFLLKKNYAEAKQGLTAPSQCLVSVLQLVELEYRKSIETCLTSEKVMSSLVDCVQKNVDFTPITCESCHTEVSILHLMLTIRMHHTLKEYNTKIQ